MQSNVHNYNSLQEIINFLRKTSYGATYAIAMSAPVAQMIISTMKIIMGEDGTNDGKDNNLFLTFVMYIVYIMCFEEILFWIIHSS